MKRPLSMGLVVGSALLAISCSQGYVEDDVGNSDSTSQGLVEEDPAAEAHAGTPESPEPPAVSMAGDAQASAQRGGDAKRKSLASLIDGSGLVFIGEALSVDTQAGEGREVRTRVQFEVSEVLLGASPGDEFALELPGGTLPSGEFLAIAGAPAFSPDETYLVFVRNGSWSLTPITQWQHGVYRQVEVDGERYFVNASGRCIERVGDEGIVPGPVLTELSDTPLGILQARAEGPAMDQEVVSSRARGCLTRDAVQEILGTRASALESRVSSRVVSLTPSGSAMTSSQSAADAQPAPTPKRRVEPEAPVPAEKP